MITEITYPTTEEESFVKGVADINGIILNFEVPGIFVDGTFDKDASDQILNKYIEDMQKQIQRVVNGSAANGS